MTSTKDTKSNQLISLLGENVGYWDWVDIIKINKFGVMLFIVFWDTKRKILNQLSICSFN